MRITEEDYKNINCDKGNEIYIKINLFLLLLVEDKLLYYNNNVFEVIKSLNELQTFDKQKFKYFEICKVIYHTYFLSDLYDDNIYELINNDNAEQLFNYIIYCNNNDIINDRIIKLTQIFINTNKKTLLKQIGYHYFNYASILIRYNENNIDDIITFSRMIRQPKLVYLISSPKSEDFTYYNFVDKKKILYFDYIKLLYPDITASILNSNRNILTNKIINNEPCIANILPILINDLLYHMNGNIYIIPDNKQNKNNYKKYDKLNLTNAYNNFIIKKTNNNYKLYDLLMYIFYDKYILNFDDNHNNIFIINRRFGVVHDKDKIYSLSYIYLSKYWDFIENQLLEENIFDTLEYKELFDLCKIINNNYYDVKKYLFSNNLQSPNIAFYKDILSYYANCMYIQLKKNSNIPFIYAYMIYINFISNKNSEYINSICSEIVRDIFYHVQDDNYCIKTCFINTNLIKKYFNKNENKSVYINKLNDLYDRTMELKNIDIDKIINKTYFIKYHENIFKNENKPFGKFFTNNKNLFYNDKNLNLESEYFKDFIKNIVIIINSVYNFNMTIYNIKPKFIEIIHNYIIQNFISCYKIDMSNIYYIFNNAITNVTHNFITPHNVELLDRMYDM